MQKNTLIYVAVGAVVLVLLGGGYMFKHQIKNLLMPQTAAPQEVVTVPVVTPTPNPVATSEGIIASETVVEKTETGFSPKSVTVKKGAVVKFINKSLTPMWVASAPHPTHTDYPEFDQKSNGDTFSFTFTKVGNWKYHNHAPFLPGGVVVVTE